MKVINGSQNSGNVGLPEQLMFLMVIPAFLGFQSLFFTLMFKCWESPARAEPNSFLCTSVRDPDAQARNGKNPFRDLSSLPRSLCQHIGQTEKR